MLKTLVDLGISEFDAHLYVFLGLNGPSTVVRLSKMMKLNKQQVYHSLKKLKDNNVVIASNDTPTVFSAVCFAKVLDFLSKKKKEKAQALANARDELLLCWKVMVEKTESTG